MRDKEIFPRKYQIILIDFNISGGGEREKHFHRSAGFHLVATTKKGFPPFLHLPRDGFLICYHPKKYSLPQ